MYIDWIKQRVSGTPGTGAITLSSALPSYIPLSSDSRAVEGALIHYSIEDGSNREVGIGTYSTTGPTLTRTVVYAKLEGGSYTENPGTPLNLTSAAIVSCTIHSTPLNFRGALVFNNASQNTTASGAWYTMTWNSESYDTSSFHDTTTNTSRITIPNGVSKIKLWGNAEFPATAVTGLRGLRFYKNGTGVAPGTSEILIPANVSAAAAIQSVSLSTPTLNVVAGDYFEMQVFQSSGTAAIAIGTNSTTGDKTYFAVQAVQ